jgi:restriction endonuclease S subunit
LFVGHRLFLQKKDIWFHPNRIDFLVAHFHPATVVHFAPAKVVQFNPARVVYYDRFLHSRANLDIPSKYIIKNGDVLFSWSGTLAVDIWSGENSGLNQHLFKVSSEIYPKWFYFLWTKFYLEEFVRIADGKKTSMGHIKRSDLDEATVLIPVEKDLKKMNSIFEPLFDLLIHRKTENNKLRGITHLLLSSMTKSKLEAAL